MCVPHSKSLDFETHGDLGIPHDFSHPQMVDFPAMTTGAVVASPLLNLRLLGAMADFTWESLAWELITTTSTVMIIPTLVGW